MRFDFDTHYSVTSPLLVSLFIIVPYECHATYLSGLRNLDYS